MNRSYKYTILYKGSIQSQKWMTHMCMWNRQTSSLTQFQRNALNFGYYRNNCSCIVSLRSNNKKKI